MRLLLVAPGYEVVTAVAKSSDGKKVDGSATAQERIAYKMLRFKRDPLKRKKTFVVALNHAFEKYTNPVCMELNNQASYLNGVDNRGQIIVLSSKRDYEHYVAEVFGEELEEDDD